MKDNQQILQEKLNEFIRKYYYNQLLRGGLIALSLLLALYIGINLLEYFAYLNPLPRTILFDSWIIITLYIVVKFIVVPLSKLYRIGHILSHEEAAELIGKHFPDVNDKLLNTLQLQHLTEEKDHQDFSLLEASINQKISQLKPIVFTSAIDLRINRKYLKYVIPPTLILLTVLLISPTLITEPTKRILEHNESFERPMPFQFVIDQKSLVAIQQEDYELSVALTGKVIPDEVFVIVNKTRYKMSKKSKMSFSHTFKNTQKDIQLNLEADEYTSKDYTIQVLPKPTILNFDIALTYPSYIGKKNETLANTGDLSIPEGTQVEWKFYTKDTKTILLTCSNTSYNLINNNKTNTFSLKQRFLKSSTYSVKTINQYLTNKDSLSYLINVIPDTYPAISVEESKDSVIQQNFYFRGAIKDDYGFKKLLFKYKKLNSENKSDTIQQSNTILINPSITQQQFFYNFNLAALNIQPGDEVEYYFEIWDNDGVNGSKATRSQINTFKAPTEKEISEHMEQSNKQVKQDMNELMQDAKDLQKAAEDLNKKLLEKKTIGWEEKKQMQDLLKKQQELQKNIENLKQQTKEKTAQENQIKQPNEQLLEKQQQLQKLMDELMTDEMKKLFEEMNKMLDKTDKDKLKQMLDEMKLNNKDIEKELDRNLEIFKELEVAKKLDDNIEKLKDLQQKQSDLSKETEQNKTPNKELQDKQEKLNEEFQDFKKEMESLEKKNSELEEPNKLENSDQQEKKIEQEQQNSSNELQNKKNQKASQSQKNASEQMKKMADQLESMQAEMEQQGAGEDIKSLRTILDNLIKVSFSQEGLMNKLKKTPRNNPEFPKVISQQKKLKDDLQMIEDSLFALSKRQPMIAPIVNREINKINQSVEQTIDALLKMNTIGFVQGNKESEALVKQQYAMTSINNLALLLSESLEAMQQQMMAAAKKQQSGKPSMKSGNKQCNNPGNGKPSIKSMRQMQEALNKQLEALKKGQQPNGQKPGQGMSEQLAKMAAQQAAIRNQLREMQNELQKSGKGGSGEIDQMMNDMDKTEKDLVNKMVTQETLNRQQKILTKLLESEKADLERELDENRESDEAKNQTFRNNFHIFEYNNKDLKEEEIIRTVPPTLNNFYKNKVNQYFYNFDTSK